ncbi:MAG: hypothetical protein GYA53_08525, partial [Acidobacteria bacterium]|nr:hypothetical protein [Acidobacteriota bacterium]
MKGQALVRPGKTNFWLQLLIICFCLSLGFIFFNPALAGAQTSETQKSKPQLSLEKIMAGQEFYGIPPSSPTWAVDGKTLYFQWKKPGEKSSEIYAVSLKNPVPVKIRREQVLDNPPDGGQVGGGRFRGRGGFGFGRFGSQWSWDKNHQRLLITQNGEIFLYRLADKKIQQLVAGTERTSGASFTFDEKGVYFLAKENLYLLSLADGTLKQLTSFTREKPPAPRTPGEVEKWYEDQQRELFKEVFRVGFEGGEQLRRG